MNFSALIDVANRGMGVGGARGSLGREGKDGPALLLTLSDFVRLYVRPWYSSEIRA